MRESVGVMEWWSNDKDLFKRKFELMLFPTLQCSNVPLLQNSFAIFTGNPATGGADLPLDQVSGTVMNGFG